MAAGVAGLAKVEHCAADAAVSGVAYSKVRTCRGGSASLPLQVDIRQCPICLSLLIQFEHTVVQR
jgi:hypothetical protein